jgi:malonate-semialdehyde dehydrogenase (acetylating)/methylmalonate-semialdehyde dehydrogenase
MISFSSRCGSLLHSIGAKNITASNWIRCASSSSKPPTVKNWIDGRAVESKTTDWIELTNPATNEVIGLVPKSTQAEMNEAVESCK